MGQQVFTLPVADPRLAVFGEELAVLLSMFLQGVLLHIMGNPLVSPSIHDPRSCLSLPCCCVASFCDGFTTTLPLSGVCGS